jgi:hypothetical protein
MCFLLFEALSQMDFGEDPHVTRESWKQTLFLDFIRKLPHLLRALGSDFGALDECGSIQSPGILKAMTGAASNAVIIRGYHH